MAGKGLLSINLIKDDAALPRPTPIPRPRHAARKGAEVALAQLTPACGAGGVAWEDVSPMGEREVYDLLFPEQAELNEATAQIEYDYAPPS